METNKAFTKKANSKNGSNGNGNRAALRHELDAQGLVPLPAKTCFYCKRSCRKAPLIACDYCPLLFHQVSRRVQTPSAHWPSIHGIPFNHAGLLRSTADIISDGHLDVSAPSATVRRLEIGVVDFGHRTHSIMESIQRPRRPGNDKNGLLAQGEPKESPVQIQIETETSGMCRDSANG